MLAVLRNAPCRDFRRCLIKAAAPPPLAALSNASLGWPGATLPSLEKVDLTVQAAASGGHVCLGRNGSGKTLLGASLVHGFQDEWIFSGSLSHREGWSARSSSHVSFESHEALLEEGGSVYRALGVPPGATPTKAAKFLLVRFGLHPLLYRPVTALSTGEIRKVMLARALATRPSLLVLDNAFDGLDVPSREALKELISTVLNGFGQLLVQGVDANATAHTQVLMFTHRAEEIVDEIASVSFLGGGVGGTPSGASCRREGLLYTEARDGRSADQLMRAAFEDRSEVRGAASRGLTPTVGEVAALWGTPEPQGVALVEANGLRVCRDGSVLLHGLDWKVRRGEHWLIAGGNGAGKSTLSRLLARVDVAKQGAEGSLSVLGDHLKYESPPATDAAVSGTGASVGEGTSAAKVDEWREARATAVGAAQHLAMLREVPQGQERLRRRPPPPRQREGVGWVSTELHLAVSRSTALAADVIGGGQLGAGACGSGREDGEMATIARWLGLDEQRLVTPFAQMSQGEQKLTLIAAALARRPALLVLDEPMQGLDGDNRARVLRLVERVCSSTGTSLVYITHHYEEVIPCVTHVLHLRGGVAEFCGERAAYEQSRTLAEPTLDFQTDIL